MSGIWTRVAHKGVLANNETISSGSIMTLCQTCLHSVQDIENKERAKFTSKEQIERVHLKKE